MEVPFHTLHASLVAALSSLLCLSEVLNDGGIVFGVGVAIVTKRNPNTVRGSDGLGICHAFDAQCSAQECSRAIRSSRAHH
ncbi:MAG: hypothetical protein ACI9DF_001211 [Verrucomicrobiales bacterium]